jgi:hypothetical protein
MCIVIPFLLPFVVILLAVDLCLLMPGALLMSCCYAGFSGWRKYGYFLRVCLFVFFFLRGAVPTFEVRLLMDNRFLSSSS